MANRYPAWELSGEERMRPSVVELCGIGSTRWAGFRYLYKTRAKARRARAQLPTDICEYRELRIRPLDYVDGKDGS